MAVLHAAQRDSLDGGDFAVPGKRKLPIHDKTHALLAWRMVDRTGGLSDAERASARSAIKGRLKTFGIDTSNYEQHSDTFIPSGFAPEYLSSALSFIEDLSTEAAFELTGEVMSTLGGAIINSLKLLQVYSDAPQQLAFCFSDGAGILVEDEKPKLRLPMAKIGTYVHPKYGIVDFKQRDFDDMVENFKLGEAGFRPYLRYGHAKFPEANDAEPAIAFLERIEQEDDVLWGIFDPIKDFVVQQVDDREYVHGSAELKRHAISKRDGRPIGTLLTAHALTNAPFIPDLPYNQVLSDSGSGERFITLAMTTGDQQMYPTPDQVLSAIEEQLGQTLSITAEQREALREKLSSMGKKPDEVCSDDAGVVTDQGGTTQMGVGDAAAAEGLSDNKKDDPDAAGDTAEGADHGNKPDAADAAEAADALGGNRMERTKDGAGDHHTPEKNSDTPAEGEGEENSDTPPYCDACDRVKSACVCNEEMSHGDPLRTAAAALDEMAKKEDDEESREKMSLLGQLLSTVGGLFGRSKKKAGAEEYSQGGSAGDPTDPQNSDQNPQIGAGNLGDNSPETQALSEGDGTVTKEEIEALVAAQLSAQSQAFEQKLSDAVSAKDGEIAVLNEKLAAQEKATMAAAGMAQQFSNSLVESAFTARCHGLVATGIPPAVVDAVADVARGLRGTTQKLSDGAEVDTAEALFRALEKMPGANRVDFAQVGQQVLSDSDPNPYADIIANAAAAAKSAK
jgi:hypothetical protein